MNKNFKLFAIAASAVLVAAPGFALAQSSGNGAPLQFIGSEGQGPVCLPILRQLVRGSSGSEVSLLQQFLTAEGAYNGPVTGYFGSLTENALKQWQGVQGIVSSGSPSSTGWGAVGPRTRLALRNSCAPADDLGASPRTGTAPLAVTFTATIPSDIAGATYAVDFGDGMTAAFTSSTEGTTTLSHTYSADGTYTSRLIQMADTGATSTIGRAVIFVGSITASKPPVFARLVTPTLLNVGRQGVWKIATALRSGDSDITVAWGDGTVDTVAASTTINGALIFKHKYSYAGTFSPRFTATNAQGSRSVVYPVVVFDRNGSLLTVPPMTTGGN